ncbi:hypothetical protein L1987_61172 [Smallanthus sonchifolius]|uniref:Uncharacterized protein n=1 Tax=Smallanthus sonchifolius TaxID=185202 RepID=A0ACB9DAQ8_9ASTR|nr:hypothetical protein L1987_61172 [Smallanthus sonchifolius]
MQPCVMRAARRQPWRWKTTVVVRHDPTTTWKPRKAIGARQVVHKATFEKPVKPVCKENKDLHVRRRVTKWNKDLHVGCASAMINLAC